VPHEPNVPAHLESLWIWSPDLLTAPLMAELREATCCLDGDALEIPQTVIDGARAGRPVDAVEYADRLFDRLANRTSVARQIALTASVLLPTAFGRSSTSCRRLVALFRSAVQAPAELGLFQSLTRPQERALLLRHIAEWEAWCNRTPRAAAPNRLSSADSRTRPQAGAAPQASGNSARPNAVPVSSERETARKNPAVQVLRAEIPDPDAAGAVDLQRYRKLEAPVPVGALAAETALAPLDFSFLQFAEVTQGIREELRLAARVGAQALKLSPRLVVGPPGTGKSRYLRALGEALGRPVRVLSAAAADGRALIGTARGWSSAVPSFPVTAIASALRADPILIVDEVDKADRNHLSANFQAGLLGLIEPSTAAAWYDECLMADCDLSWVGWMLTANDLSGILTPLANRCRVHCVGPPLSSAFEAYLQTIYGDIANELGVPVAALPQLDPAIRDALRRAFARNPALRALKRAVRRALSLAPKTTCH
jgi:hypothetical protein